MKRTALTIIAAGMLLLAAGCSQDDSATRSGCGNEGIAACPRTSLCLSRPPAADAGRSARRSVAMRFEAHRVVPEENWFAMGRALTVAATDGGDGPENPASVGSDGEPWDRTYSHWSRRKGPAYSGDFWHSLGRDSKEFLPIVWDDTVAVARSPFAWGCFAAAAATGIALSGDGGNNQVERHFSRNGSQLNTFWDSVGDVFGNPAFHFGVGGGMYLVGLGAGDDDTYAKGKMMLSALSINGLLTMGLKVAARTESPNGDEFGWPSGHTSSSFCFAAVMYEAYGPWAGVPLYAFAAFVGYERIDARNHDFADVISGAFLGMAIGHLVARNHQPRILGMDVLPYVDPRTGALGIALSKSW